MENIFNIYMTGVGGQGIGMLSEIIIKAADLAGQTVAGTDTHGLAQRGGMVESTLRIGNNVHSPLIMKRTADLVIALEIHEAYLGTLNYLREKGTLVYYDVSLQPLFTRLGMEKEVTEQDIKTLIKSYNSNYLKVFDDSLNDPKMQNIALLAEINRNTLIPGITEEHYIAAMKMLMNDSVFERNIKIFCCQV
ncbi:MAG: hypothetical protein A2W91_00340 [Bacteroidetes bacterium GWF2_38_335]|nr:MAG: hypothetical protein A2W91_00340 [Bacteroidetes bacterium GWF2_38_335]OFY78281.1 MAG: hypothetical protein A2281_03720 [Bacteroidetes bacterium RIFOXYA12_FULL_38_20]HBS87524.1 pyruvate ferredoxin oxidoreductase [Bacteroidales bacterium]